MNPPYPSQQKSNGIKLLFFNKIVGEININHMKAIITSWVSYLYVNNTEWYLSSLITQENPLSTVKTADHLPPNSILRHEAN